MSIVIRFGIASYPKLQQAFGIVKSMNRYLPRYRNAIVGLFAGRQNKPDTLKQGRWKEFNKHAILIAEGDYLNGKKHGRWREYFDTGELMIEEDFEHGISNGRFVSYHRNGKVLSEGQFENGLRVGEFIVYDESGKRIRSLQFEEDNLILEKCLAE